MLPLGLLLAGGAAVAGWRRRDDDDDGPDRDWTRAVGLAAAFALAYTFVIARVGGDFMFARLLIPATPFFLILFELGLERIAVRRAAVRGAIAAVALAGMIVTPVPVGGDEWKSGVADEWKYYQRRDRDSLEASCGRLRTMFRGLPIRAAFVGTEALIAYCSEVPLAIEATTGLTDSFIAHQPLTKRGRPGHEKNAPFSYLIDQRKAHFILVPAGYVVDTLAPYVPVIDVKFAGLPAAVLNWDEPLMRELVRRGAEVMDFLPTLDWYIRAMPTMSDSAVRADYTKLRRYYFDDANDPARERPFLERLGRSK